jgi:hypothetical protein
LPAIGRGDRPAELRGRKTRGRDRHHCPVQPNRVRTGINVSFPMPRVLCRHGKQLRSSPQQIVSEPAEGLRDLLRDRVCHGYRAHRHVAGAEPGPIGAALTVGHRLSSYWKFAGNGGCYHHAEPDTRTLPSGWIVDAGLRRESQTGANVAAMPDFPAACGVMLGVVVAPVSQAASGGHLWSILRISQLARLRAALSLFFGQRDLAGLQRGLER